MRFPSDGRPLSELPKIVLTSVLIRNTVQMCMEGFCDKSLKTLKPAMLSFEDVELQLDENSTGFTTRFWMQCKARQMHQDVNCQSMPYFSQTAVNENGCPSLLQVPITSLVEKAIHRWARGATLSVNLCAASWTPISQGQQKSIHYKKLF